MGVDSGRSVRLVYKMGAGGTTPDNIPLNLVDAPAGGGGTVGVPSFLQDTIMHIIRKTSVYFMSRYFCYEDIIYRKRDLMNLSNRIIY